MSIRRIGSQGSRCSGERSSRAPTTWILSLVAWQPGTLVLISFVKTVYEKTNLSLQAGLSA
jgi:hypothetical protein